MNDNNDATYYLTRAEQEDEAASRAASLIAADIHRSLAIRYRAKATEYDERPETTEREEHLKLILARD